MSFKALHHPQDSPKGRIKRIILQQGRYVRLNPRVKFVIESGKIRVANVSGHHAFRNGQVIFHQNVRRSLRVHVPQRKPLERYGDGGGFRFRVEKRHRHGDIAVVRFGRCRRFGEFSDRVYVFFA